MSDVAEGHTAPGGSPGGTGPVAVATPSSPAGPGTKTYEELLRDAESMRKSIQDLTGIKAQQEIRLRELESAQPSDTGDDYLTRNQAKAVFASALAEWQTTERTRLEAEQRHAVAFATERSGWLAEATKEVPEITDVASPVYKKAQELFMDPSQKLSVRVNGQVVPAFAAAEYIAVTRAAHLVAAAGPTPGEKKDGAAFAATGKSSGGPGPAATGEELTDEEYLKLSPEGRRAYQERKFKEQQGG